jgi:hypothetical protein
MWCRCFTDGNVYIDDLDRREISTVVFRSWSIRVLHLSAIVADYLVDESFWVYYQTWVPKPILTHKLINLESSQKDVVQKDVVQKDDFCHSWTNRGKLFISSVSTSVGHEFKLVQRPDHITKILDYTDIRDTYLWHIAASPKLFLFIVRLWVQTRRVDESELIEWVNIIDDQLNFRCKKIRSPPLFWNKLIARLDVTIGAIVILAKSRNNDLPELWLHHYHGPYRNPVWTPVLVTVNGWSSSDILFLHNRVVGQITTDNKLLIAVITNASYEPIETHTCDLTQTTCGPDCACRRLQPYRCRYNHEIFMPDNQTVVFLLSGDNGGSIWCKQKIGSPTFIHGPPRSWPPIGREQSQINIITDTILLEFIPSDKLLFVTNLDTLATQIHRCTYDGH